MALTVPAVVTSRALETGDHPPPPTRCSLSLAVVAITDVVKKNVGNWLFLENLDSTSIVLKLVFCTRIA